MKAVVTHLKNGYAVLLTQQGNFVRVPAGHYTVGQQISYSPPKHKPWRALALAACLMLCMLSTVGVLADRLACYYVSLDVNPSIEMTLNWYDRVLSIAAVNADAEPIVRSMTADGVKNQPLDTAIGMAISALGQAAYFEDDTANDVVIGVATYGIRDVTDVVRALQGNSTRTYDQCTVTITALGVNTAIIAQAKQYHTTGGKLALAERAMAAQGEAQPAVIEDWIAKPIGEIIAREQKPADGQTPDAKHTNTPGTDGATADPAPVKPQSVTPPTQPVTDAASLVTPYSQSATGLPATDKACEGVLRLPKGSTIVSPMRTLPPAVITGLPSETEKPMATQSPQTALSQLVVSQGPNLAEPVPQPSPPPDQPSKDAPAPVPLENCGTVQANARANQLPTPADRATETALQESTPAPAADAAQGSTVETEPVNAFASVTESHAIVASAGTSTNGFALSKEAFTADDSPDALARDQTSGVTASGSGSASSAASVLGSGSQSCGTTNTAKVVVMDTPDVTDRVVTAETQSAQIPTAESTGVPDAE